MVKSIFTFYMLTLFIWVLKILSPIITLFVVVWENYLHRLRSLNLVLNFLQTTNKLSREVQVENYQNEEK